MRIIRAEAWDPQSHLLELRPKETTSGVIHAYGQSLYLTITEYRVRTESANTINMANRRLPDSSGLINHTVLFLPEAAKEAG